VETEVYPLFSISNIFIIGVAEESQYRPVDPGGGLNNIRQILFLSLFIDILQVLPGAVGMLGEVVISAAGNAFQFAPAHGEVELDIGAGQGIMGQLFFAMLAQF